MGLFAAGACCSTPYSRNHFRDFFSPLQSHCFSLSTGNCNYATGNLLDTAKNRLLQLVHLGNRHYWKKLPIQKKKIQFHLPHPSYQWFTTSGPHPASNWWPGRSGVPRLPLNHICGTENVAAINIYLLFIISKLPTCGVLERRNLQFLLTH